MSVLSYAQAKQLTLDRLKKVRDSMPYSEREMPRYVLGAPNAAKTETLSILDLIRQVEMDTPLGRAYIYGDVQQLGYAVR